MNVFEQDLLRALGGNTALVSIKQVAQTTGLPSSVISRAIRNGHLGKQRDVGHKCLRADDVVRWMSASYVEHETEPDPRGMHLPNRQEVRP